MRQLQMNRRKLVRVALACALLASLSIAARASAAAPPAADPPHVDELLRDRMQGRGNQELIPIQVMLRDTGLPGEPGARRREIRVRQQRALGRLPSPVFRLKRRYESARGFAGWATAEGIELLAADPDVERVYLDRVLRTAMSEGSLLLGSNVPVAHGFTGAGINVAVLDTGVDTDHQWLQQGDIVAQQCFCDDTPAPGTGCCPNGTATQSSGNAAEDGDGHGTGMVGIITSNWPTSTGIAPAAGIVAVRVLSSEGVGTFSDLDAGLDWVLTNRALHGIRIVNLSLSEAGQYNNPNAFPCSNSTTAELIEDLANVGISVFAASGNNAYDNGISFPACAPDAIAVGSYYDKDFPNGAQFCVNASCSQLCSDVPANEGAFACFTNAGPLLDLLMPSWRAYTLDVGGSSQRAGGTSASTAYASASAALLLSVDPTLSPTQIRSLLTANGDPVTNPGSGIDYVATRLDQAFAVVLQSYDSDGDAVLDDGDGSGWIGDATCAGGQTLGCDDNCPGDANPLQEDPDADGVGDVCDVCPLDPANDADADGLCADADNCAALANPGQEDWDADGVGDACDNCFFIANPGQEDADEDGRGDACSGVIRSPSLEPSGLLLLIGALAIAGARRAGRRGAGSPRSRVDRPEARGVGVGVDG